VALEGQAVFDEAPRILNFFPSKTFLKMAKSFPGFDREALIINSLKIEDFTTALFG